MRDSTHAEAITPEFDQLAIYEAALEDARLKFETEVAPLFKEADRKVMMAFWINFSYVGIGMTEPVEDWVRRAGERCKELGYTTLGEQLRKHAIHEANHHKMMIKDTRHLVQKWNEAYTPHLDAEELFKRPLRNSVEQYQALHEDYIKSDTPYGQIAIEYEIENLTAVYGPHILEHTFKVLGAETKEFLSFVVDHAVLDVAHTAYNKKAIGQFLEEFPDATQPLIEAGIKALKIYANFLADCYEEARKV